MLSNPNCGLLPSSWESSWWSKELKAKVHVASQRGHSKGSLGSILASVSCCLSVQVSRMIYDFGKQVEIPCQYYRSLSGSISLHGASSWLSHWLLLWLIETWMPEMEVKWINPSKFFDTYLQCSGPSATSIQLMPDHHYSHLAQGCRSRWVMSDLTAVETVWHSTMPYHRSYYHGLRSEFRRAHFPIIQILKLLALH